MTGMEEHGTEYEKIEYWERHLLDLSMRNPMLNLEGSSSVYKICSDSGILEGLLREEAYPVAIPGLPARSDGKSLVFTSLREDIPVDAEIIRQELCSERVGQREDGETNLYLTYGRLDYLEDGTGGQLRMAPLILLPAEMIPRPLTGEIQCKCSPFHATFNVALIELLNRRFQIDLREMTKPFDADDVSKDLLKNAFEKVRDAVHDNPEWQMTETICIGKFPLGRLVMWEDLHRRREELVRNPLVNSLLCGKLQADVHAAAGLESLRESDLILPIQADASQMVAVQEAVSGNSFVLYGPPGTGKSQTITNLIVNMIARGKTVLFVAEKEAAINVVKEKLKSLGVDDFILDLHSNRTGKSDFLGQLERCLNGSASGVSTGFHDLNRKLGQQREQLARYENSLLEKQRCGLSLWEMANLSEAYSDSDLEAELDDELILSFDSERLEELKLLIDRMTAAGKSIGHPQNHPLAAIREKEYSQQYGEELGKRLQAYEAVLEDYEKIFHAYQDLSGVDLPGNLSEAERITRVASEIERWKTIPVQWRQSDHLKDLLKTALLLCDHQKKADDYRSRLLKKYKPEILELNGKELRDAWKKAQSGFPLFRLISSKHLNSEMEEYRTDTGASSEIRIDIQYLDLYQKETDQIEKIIKRYDAFAPFFRDGQVDTERLRATVRRAAESAAAIRRLTGDDKARTQAVISPELSVIREKLERAEQALHAEADELFRFMHVDILHQEDGLQEKDWFEQERNMCRSMIDHAGQIRDWILFNNAAGRVEDAGLSSLVQMYRNGLDHGEVRRVFMRSVLHTWIRYVVRTDEELNHFSGVLREEQIAEYQRQTLLYREAAKEEVQYRLRANLPDRLKSSQSSEEPVRLNRYIRSRGKGAGIRYMIGQLPDLMKRMSPCILMSPMTAAAYLPDEIQFDLVVYDEASQMTASRAAGSLSRGKAAVIAGDPKQLPPTSFFKSQDNGREMPEEADLDSILEDCLALNLPESCLRWHYRSTHESLIAFSNHYFYQDRMMTFPSADDRSAKVHLVQVEGTFESGATRQNLKEAQAIIGELKARFKTPVQNEESIGVVSFNVQQKQLIEELLEKELEEDHSFREWCENQSLFVKNLENVQGDERDTILFSVTYGPNQEGNVSLNFGPLNQDGGWRRLNVAVTRAKREMVIFTSLKEGMVRFEDSPSEGVKALGQFLRYAAGSGQLNTEKPFAGKASVPDRGLDIAGSLCMQLEAHGYRTARNIGHSDLRIDVAVIDPDDELRYRLGILLDGSCYSMEGTVYDKEIGAESVLRQLGWNIRRLWTIDWLDNRDREVDRILRELDGKREKDDNEIT